jgi:hypothetical protein
MEEVPLSYEDAVRQVAIVHVDEIRADLDRTYRLLGQAEGKVDELRRQATSLERLLAMASDSEGTSSEPERLPLHDAMSKVLRESPVGMMRAGDLAAEINKQGLYRMRDGRPVEPQQIHARVGNYDHLFTREGTFIKLIA